MDHVKVNCCLSFMVYIYIYIFVDIDECKEENACNNETEICDNLPGTFMCKSNQVTRKLKENVRRLSRNQRKRRIPQSQGNPRLKLLLSPPTLKVTQERSIHFSTSLDRY